jgi:hypothetical protein
MANDPHAETLRILNHLLEWNEHTGGWTAPIWEQARKFRDSLLPDDQKPPARRFRVEGTVHLAAGFSYVVEASGDGEAETLAEARARDADDLGPEIQEVCVQSVTEVDDARRALRPMRHTLPGWTWNDGETAMGEGWGICEATPTHGGPFLLMKDDSVVSVFDEDKQAWAHVWVKADRESTALHCRALEFIRWNSPDEYARIEKFMAKANGEAR